MAWQNGLQGYYRQKRALTRNTVVAILSLLIVGTLMLNYEEVHASEDSDHYSVLVVAGQSNAQGDTSFHTNINPPLGSHPADSETQIMWSTGDEQLSQTWRNSSDSNFLPLTSIQPKGYFGPEIALARNLWDQGRRNMVFLKVTYGLQRLAKTPNSTFGGLADWNINSNGESYDKLKQRKDDLAAIMQSNEDTYSMDGFYWMQGESDAVKAETVENYQENLTDLLEAIKVDLDMHPDAINVIGKISGQQCLSNVYNVIYNPSGCAVSICILAVHPCSTFAKVSAGNVNVRQAIQNIADDDSRTFVVETEDLLRGSDFIHLTSASQLTFGKRMANAQFKLPYRLEGTNDYDDDGILNHLEDVNGDGNLGNDDSDGDGIPDYLDSLAGPGGGRTNNAIASKSLVDDQGNDIDGTRPGSSLNWKFAIQNETDSPTDLLLTESLSDRQEFIADSLQAPPNYQKEYSTNNGESFLGDDQQAGINTLRVSKTNLPISATGDSNEVTANAESFENSTSDNEGYLPILISDRVFTLFRRTLVGEGPGIRKYDIGCVSKSTGENCPGYPKDFYDDQGNSDFVAPYAPVHYADEDGRIFSSTQRNAGFGIVCFDTNINDMCVGQGYTELDDAGGPLGGKRNSRIQQINKIGDCLFTYDYTLRVYSYDPQTGATPCGEHSTKNLVSAYGGPVTAYNLSNHSAEGSPGPITQSQVIGSKMYIYMNYAYEANLDIFGCNFAADICRGTRLICFDSATLDGRCSNGDGGHFSNPRPHCYNDRWCKFTQPFINKIDNSICAFGYKDPSFTYIGIFCHDALTGTLIPNTDELNSISTIGRAEVDMANFLPTLEEADMTLPNGDEITIFAWEKAYLIASPRSGKAVCFNWTTNSLCDGFGNTGTGSSRWDPWTHDGVTSNEVGVTGDTNDFGYVPDENGCLWAKGKSGDTWSFDAQTGSVPCRRYAQEVTVEPLRFYCEALPSKITGWHEAKIQMPIGTSIEDLSELTVTIKDENSATVAGYESVDLLTLGTNVSELGVLDISNISAETYPELNASFDFKAKNSLPWSSENMTPLVILTFSGEDPEICYRTVVDDSCNIITPITNNSDLYVTDQLQSTTSLGLSATAIVEYEDGEMCVPDIRITTTFPSSKVYPSQLITYNILVENIASDDPLSRATDIELASYLPSNITYVSSSGGTFDQDRVLWPTFNLNGFTSQEFELTVRVGTQVQGNLLLVTNAILTDDPTPHNNIFTAYSEIGTYSMIRATAWIDENEDGIADEDEIYLDNVEVELYQEQEFVGSKMTNSDGVAEFTDVTPGTGYQLKFVKPNGFDTSPKRTDVVQSNASTINEEDQTTDVFVLGEGEVRDGIFAGFFPTEISQVPADEERSAKQALNSGESASDAKESDSEQASANTQGLKGADEILDIEPIDSAKNELGDINTILIYSALVGLNVAGIWFLIREVRKNKKFKRTIA